MPLETNIYIYLYIILINIRQQKKKMSMKMSTNPLEIPQLIDHVMLYVPVWDVSSSISRSVHARMHEARRRDLVDGILEIVVPRRNMYLWRLSDILNTCNTGRRTLPVRATLKTLLVMLQEASVYSGNVDSCIDSYMVSNAWSPRHHPHEATPKTLWEMAIDIVSTVRFGDVDDYTDDFTDDDPLWIYSDLVHSLRMPARCAHRAFLALATLPEIQCVVHELQTNPMRFIDSYDFDADTHRTVMTRIGR